MAEPQLASEADDDSDDPRALETLVGDWSYLPDIAERYGVALSRVRRFLADRELLTHRVGPNRALAAPMGHDPSSRGPSRSWPMVA